jgi:small subunit ribosomal protein S4
MGRYTGPKGRINRRLSSMVYENSGATRAFEKRETPPGQHGRRRKQSNYGLALAEKQKIKHYYGMREEQLRKYFEIARRFRGNTGAQLLIQCECRLDNVVRRAGFTMSRPQARQGIVHGHFQINGQTVNKPSIQVRAGDVISVRKRPNIQALYRGIVEGGSIPRTDWISFDPSSLEARVSSLPGQDDISLPVDVGQVVAFMSR